MIAARSEATVSAAPAVVFASATDLEGADWLPAVRRVTRVGSATGVGARYAVEVGLLGRRLSGVLVCSELDPPRSAVYTLEEGLDLTIQLVVSPAGSGSRIEVTARYAVTGRPFGGAIERASAAPARREVARAVEQLAARFGTALHGHPRV